MSDRHTRIVVEVAVTSAMLAASTSVFAWTFSRFTDTMGYRYCVPLIVYGTIWTLVVVFSAGVVWSLAEQAHAWAAGPRPPTPPGPTPPPGQPRPGDTPRPAPGPIQPRPPRPPRSLTETTLVDMAPVSDVTQELPRVVHAADYPMPEEKVFHTTPDYQVIRLPRHVPSGDWRPPVAPNSKERN